MKLSKSTLITVSVALLTVITITAIALLLNWNSNKQTDDPNSTSAMVTDEQGNIIDVPGIIPIDPNATGEYDPDVPHGVKKMYGVNIGGDFAPKDALAIWRDYYFVNREPWLEYYDYKSTANGGPLCFDPLCNHMVDTCPAFYQHDTYLNSLGYPTAYPNRIYIDYYDNANSPVFYSTHRRSDTGHIGEEIFYREPYYVIQRYDLSSGKRITLCEGIENLVQSVYTYGDYLYYTMSEDYLGAGSDPSDCAYTLAVIPKIGGEQKFIQDENTLALDVLSIDDSGVYYLVNSRYIYHCSPTLDDPTQIVDLDSIKDEQGKNTQFATLHNGYLYYFGNLVACELIYLPDTYSGDCYRIPMNDFSVPATKIAENVICGKGYTTFTNNYLYYMPAILQEAGSGAYPLTPVNFSNGVVKAVHLTTGETVTCCEVPGVSFYAGNTVEEDSIFITGKAYDSKELTLVDEGRNVIRLYPDGRPYEIMFNTLKINNGLVYG